MYIDEADSTGVVTLSAVKAPAVSGPVVSVPVETPPETKVALVAAPLVDMEPADTAVAVKSGVLMEFDVRAFAVSDVAVSDPTVAAPLVDRLADDSAVAVKADVVTDPACAILAVSENTVAGPAVDRLKPWNPMDALSV